MHLSLFALLLHPKTTYLSGIFILSTEAKTVPNKSNGLELDHKLRYTQTSLSDSAARSCLEKESFFTIYKTHKKIRISGLYKLEKYFGYKTLAFNQLLVTETGSFRIYL